MLKIIELFKKIFNKNKITLLEDSQKAERKNWTDEIRPTAFEERLWKDTYIQTEDGNGYGYFNSLKLEDII